MTDAQALVDLSEQAGSAASQSASKAALDAVLERLEKALSPIEPGVLSSPFWDELGEADRKALESAAERAARAVTPIVDAPDSVIASYGLNDDSTRGALAEIGISFGEFNRAVKEAQDSLFAKWANDLWPADRIAELEIHALVPVSREQADTVLALWASITKDQDSYLIRSAEDIRALREAVLEAMTHAKHLHDLPVPRQVLKLFRESLDDSRVPLSVLSPEALRWLEDHGASDLFVLQRADQ
jgi:hypothetical protein